MKSKITHRSSHLRFFVEACFGLNLCLCESKLGEARNSTLSLSTGSNLEVMIWLQDGPLGVINGVINPRTIGVFFPQVIGLGSGAHLVWFWGNRLKLLGFKTKHWFLWTTSTFFGGVVSHSDDVTIILKYRDFIQDQQIESPWSPPDLPPKSGHSKGPPVVHCHSREWDDALETSSFSNWNSCIDH